MTRWKVLVLGALILALSGLGPVQSSAWATTPCAHVVSVHIAAGDVYLVDDRRTTRDEVVKVVSEAVNVAACADKPFTVSGDPQVLYGDLIALLNRLEQVGLRNWTLLDPKSDPPGQPI